MESSRSYRKIQKFTLSRSKKEKIRLRWLKQPWKNNNEKNPENKIDPNEARSSVYETAIYMEDLYKHETGNTGIRPGATVDVAIGDINGDGQPSIAVTKIEDKSK